MPVLAELVVFVLAFIAGMVTLYAFAYWRP